MGALAHAFYLVADLKGPIRPNFRAPCHFFIDPSIQPDSITRIQLSNLLFDLLGIHEKVQIEAPRTIQCTERFLIPRCLEFCIFRESESRLACARSRVSMSNRRLKRLRCGWWSPKFPGLTDTDPEEVSERGEDFITLVGRELNSKRWLAHSGIALKDLSGIALIRGHTPCLRSAEFQVALSELTLGPMA
jgi:hypothetical protein